MSFKLNPKAQSFKPSSGKSPVALFSAGEQVWRPDADVFIPNAWQVSASSSLTDDVYGSAVQPGAKAGKKRDSRHPNRNKTNDPTGDRQAPITQRHAEFVAAQAQNPQLYDVAIPGGFRDYEKVCIYKNGTSRHTRKKAKHRNMSRMYGYGGTGKYGHDWQAPGAIGGYNSSHVSSDADTAGYDSFYTLQHILPTVSTMQDRGQVSARQQYDATIDGQRKMVDQALAADAGLPASLEGLRLEDTAFANQSTIEEQHRGAAGAEKSFANAVTEVVQMGQLYHTEVKTLKMLAKQLYEEVKAAYFPEDIPAYLWPERSQHVVGWAERAYELSEMCEDELKLIYQELSGVEIVGVEDAQV